MEDLGIDLKNLAFDFGREWGFFREARVKKFLALYLRRRIELHHLALEQGATIEALKTCQGAVMEAKHLLSILDCADVSAQVKDIVTSTH